jgi:hypothetical protein
MSRLSPAAIQLVRASFKEAALATNVDKHRYVKLERELGLDLEGDPDVHTAIAQARELGHASVVAALIIHEGLIAIAEAVTRASEGT